MSVVVYVRPGCPFCATAESLLRSQSVAYHVVDVSSDADKLQELAKLAGEAAESLTVPKVWIDGTLVRSSEELKGLCLTSALAHLARNSIELPPRQPLSDESPRGATRVAVLHTGPTDVVWLSELEQRLKTRGAHVAFLDVERLGSFDPQAALPFDVLLNRVSDAVPPLLSRYVCSLMCMAELQGLPVVNGFETYSSVTSKFAQLALFRAAGLQTSTARVVRCLADVEAAAPQLLGEGRTLLFKPNAGSFGQGIAKFEDLAALREHAQRPGAFGNDGLALLEEYHDVTTVNRVFLLDGVVQCGMSTTVSAFSGQCMASAQKRRKVDGVSAVAKLEVPEEIAKGCVRAMRAAKADVCSIEYLLTPEKGEPGFFDFNLLSTYPGEALAGKDCWDELAAYILAKARPYELPTSKNVT